MYVGKSVVLKCSPPRGYPVPTITWLQDGSLVSNTSRTFVSAKGNLTISPVTKADQGSYICRASSPLGTRDSQEALLTVKGMPVNLIVVYTVYQTYMVFFIEFHQNWAQLFTGWIMLFVRYTVNHYRVE